MRIFSIKIPISASRIVGGVRVRAVGTALGIQILSSTCSVGSRPVDVARIGLTGVIRRGTGPCERQVPRKAVLIEPVLNEADKIVTVEERSQFQIR